MIKYISIALLVSSEIFPQEIIHTEKHSTEDYIVYICLLYTSDAADE